MTQKPRWMKRILLESVSPEFAFPWARANRPG